MTGASSRPRYSVAQKLAIVRFAQAHSVLAACGQFGVARSSVYIWLEKEEELARSASELNHTTQFGNGTPPPLNPPTRASPTTAPVATCTQPNEDTDGARASEHISPGSATLTQQDPQLMLSEINGEERPGELLPTEAHAHGRGCTPDNATNEDPPTAFVLVGYQGSTGGFAQRAAERSFNTLRSNQALPTPSFELTGYPEASYVLDALQRKEIDYAFIATNVLLSNTDYAALDRLVDSRLRMIGEVTCTEQVAVCALPGTEICDADCVVSDWATLQHHEKYIHHLEMQFGRHIYRQVTWDSAAGCRIVREEQAKNALILCTSSAAAANGLTVLQCSALGTPFVTRYSVIARAGTDSLAFASIPREALSAQTARRCTLFVKGTERAILDVISAFAYRGLEIVSFHMRGGEDGGNMRSYVISYKTSVDPRTEIGLHHHLAVASERVITLGIYTTLAIL